MLRRVCASVARTTSAPAMQAVRSMSTALNVHRDSDVNNKETPFEFSQEDYKEIETITAKYPKNYRRAAVLPLLHMAQERNNGWLSLSAMNKVASVLDMAPMRVYEVATFYTMYQRQPIGKHNIQVCTTTPCMVRGGYEILETIEQHLGIKCGESTPDMQFHLMEVECLGACTNAPMIQIDGPVCKNMFYEDLTKESTIAILEKLKKDEEPQMGPQNGRKNSMGIQGKTTLLEDPPGPFCREI